MVEASPPVSTSASAQRTSSEKWIFGSDSAGSVPVEYRESFLRFLSGSLAPSQSFEIASALKKQSPTESSLAFAEYWLGRTFLAMKLPGLAAERLVIFVGFG